VAVTIVSVALNIYLWRAHSPTLFYNPLVRFWEILAGNLVVWMPAPPRRARDVTGVMGLALIAASVVITIEDQNHPNLVAVAVILGTMILIWLGDDSRVGRQILGGSVLPAIGAISYPLYLWHWPLLVYARFTFGDPLRPVVAGGALILSVFLGTVTYLAVEIPFRRLNPRTQFGALVGGALVLFLIGWTFTNRLAAYHPAPESMHLGLGQAPVRRECGVNAAERSMLT